MVSSLSRGLKTVTLVLLLIQPNPNSQAVQRMESRSKDTETYVEKSLFDLEQQYGLTENGKSAV